MVKSKDILKENKKESEEGLKLLKKNYEFLAKKYNLPSFDKLNEDFQIERISEYETDLILKEIRKFIGEKFSTYLRFLENLLNPVNVPIFVFSMVKNLDNSDKKKINELYKKLAMLEVFILELDIQYSEKKEVKFLKESFEVWNDIKKDLLILVEKMKKDWDVKQEFNGKNYFG